MSLTGGRGMGFCRSCLWPNEGAERCKRCGYEYRELSHGGKSCLHCGTPTTDKSGYCGRCLVKRIKPCPDCGKLILLKSDRCGNCNCKHIAIYAKNANLGCKHSKERRDKIRLSSLGCMHCLVCDKILNKTAKLGICSECSSLVWCLCDGCGTVIHLGNKTGLCQRCAVLSIANSPLRIAAIKLRESTPEWKLKSRLSHLGKKQRPESIEKTRQYNLGRKHTEEWSENIGRGNRGKKRTSEQVAQMSIISKNYVNLHPEFREAARGRARKLWKEKPQVFLTDKYLGRVLTRPELIVTSWFTNDILNRTGGGTWWRRWVDGTWKNPDFHVPKTNRILEVWGDYFHRNDNAYEWIKKYGEVGLVCQIVWEYEILKAPEVTRERIQRFISGIYGDGDLFSGVIPGKKISNEATL